MMRSLKLITKCEGDVLHGVFIVPMLSCPYEAEHSSELNFIRNLDFVDPRPEGSKLPDIYPRFSKDTFILNSPELLHIRRFVESKINYFAREVMQSDTELVITQSWVNKITKGSHHQSHTHPHSILSGVWYPAREEVFEPITFMNPSPVRDVWLEPNKKTAFNQTSASMKIPVGKSLLLIFPSNLRHKVDFNSLDSPRFSLSFNTWSSGTLGSERRLTYLPALALDI